MISYIGRKKSGLFLPVSQTLDILKANKLENNKSDYIPFYKKLQLEFFSLYTRIKYRYLKKIDDFHFKKSNLYNES